jgi:hypothetical protein
MTSSTWRDWGCSWALATSILFLGFGAGTTRAESYLDPTADTFGSGTRLDVTSVVGNATPTGLNLTVNFATPILPPSSSAANSVAGIIDIDLDNNAATGSTPRINTLIGSGLVPTPTVTLGSEIYVDLLSEQFSPGFVSIFNAATSAPITTTPITFTSNSFSLFIPGTLVGPTVAVDLVIGNLGNPTDRVPNSSVPLLFTVPEPSSFLMCGLAAVVLGGVAWGRRSR